MTHASIYAIMELAGINTSRLPVCFEGASWHRSCDFVKDVDGDPGDDLITSETMGSRVAPSYLPTCPQCCVLWDFALELRGNK